MSHKSTYKYCKSGTPFFFCFFHIQHAYLSIFVKYKYLTKHVIQYYNNDTDQYLCQKYPRLRTNFASHQYNIKVVDLLSQSHLLQYVLRKNFTTSFQTAVRFHDLLSNTNSLFVIYAKTTAVNHAMALLTVILTTEDFHQQTVHNPVYQCCRNSKNQIHDNFFVFQ